MILICPESESLELTKYAYCSISCYPTFNRTFVKKREKTNGHTLGVSEHS